MNQAKLPTNLLRSNPIGEVTPIALKVNGSPQLDLSDSTTRAGLLRLVRDGDQVELAATVIGFRQMEGVPNRNFVRFKPKILRSLAKSFAGVPFLRDHDQGDLTARGGTVTAARVDKTDQGEHIFEMDIALTAPWAVEAMLTKNLDRFSIGWDHAGFDTVECSLCKAPIFSECSHFPGDLVENKDESHSRVEFVYTQATGVELSAVSVPAVVGTGVESIRQTLASFCEKLEAQSPPHRKAKSMKSIAKILGLDEQADESVIVAALKARETASVEVLTQLNDERTQHGATRTELESTRAALAEMKAGHGKITAEGLLSKYADRLSHRDKDGKKVDHPMAANIRELCDLGQEKIAESTLAAMPAANSRETAQALTVPDKVEGEDKRVPGALHANPLVEKEIRKQAGQMGTSLETIRKYSDLVD